MKTLISFFILFFIILNGFSQDVQIPNNNFENWKNNTFYEEPTGYTTSNYYLYKKLNVVTVTKTTDKYQGNYALKLQTVATGTQDTVAGSADYITILQGEKSVTGFPFVEKPVAFKGHVKYNTSNNDSVLIYFGFKKNGREIYYKEYKLYGHQTSYNDVFVNIENFEETPDTAFVGFSSSTSPPFAKKNKAMGENNFLVIDDISFVGAATPIPNGDFEEWEEAGYNEPEAWATFNKLCFEQNLVQYVTETEGINSIDKALKIRNTKIFDNIGNPRIISQATTGKMELTNPNIKKANNIYITGGFPINSHPDSLSFYYKYDNSFNTKDFGLVIIEFRKGGKVVFEQRQLLLPSSQFTHKKIKIDINSPQLPPGVIADSANIILSSSNYLESDNFSSIGNTLIIDDINFIYNSAQPEKFKLSGIVNYDNKGKTILKDVKLVLKNKEGNEIATTMSDAEGKYVFDKLDKGEYTLTASTGKIWRKVIPIDALFINRSFISVYKIGSEFKKKAADVDGNKSVTPIDALFINRRFLGMVKTFKISDWLFDIPAIINLDKDMVLNIKALCAGDLRGDYKP